MDAELFFFAKTVVKTLAFAPGNALALGALALIAWAIGRRRIAAGLGVAGFALIFLTALPVVSDLATRLALAEPPYLSVDAPRPDADAIVILAGGAARDDPAYGGDVISMTTMRRTHYGATLHRRYGLPMLVTGAAPTDTGLGEAQGMAAFLREMGLEPRWVEDASYDTHDNARLTHAILANEGIDRIILVTSATHIQRAVGLFEAEGFVVTPAPVGGGGRHDRAWRAYLPKPGAMSQFNRALNEALGRAAYAVSDALGL